MNKLVSILMIAAIFLVACSKEKLNKQSSNQTSDVCNEIKLVTLTDGSKSTAITMLEFTSIEHYENTIANLKALVEQHENTFLTTWYHLNDDSLNAKQEEVGFVDNQPLIDFENTYNISSSMRQAFELAETEWLNHEVLDADTDPSKIYCFDMAEMTLLNANGEVKIGDVLLKLTNKGFVKIDNVDVATLIRINEGDLSAYLEPTVTTNIEFDEDRGDCTSWKGKDIGHKYQSNKKVVMHVHFHSYPWKGVATAKITSYKKSGNKWKLYKMNLGVAVQSCFRDKDCKNSFSAWSGWKHKKAKSLSISNSFWGAFPQYRAENGASVFGMFQYAGNSSTVVLTW